MHARRASWSLVLLLVAVAGCKSGPEADIPLKEVRDDAFGYVIRVPAAATQTEAEGSRRVWTWTFHDQLDSYHCIIEPEPDLATFTADAARKRVAEVRAGEDIKQVEASGADGWLVEMAEDERFHYREAWCFRRGKTTTMVAICEGPAHGGTVTVMATSLRATR